MSTIAGTSARYLGWSTVAAVAVPPGASIGLADADGSESAAFDFRTTVATPLSLAPMLALAM